ncbi:fructoselysine kinase [Spirochaetia bacterium]|nr:fructoselysine kinase [Spirochaetia bacterium]
MKIATIGDNCVDAYKSIGMEYFGGNCVNVAVQAVRQGMQTAYVGALGDDETGKRFLEVLKKEGIDTSHIRILSGKTAVTQVELINGDRQFGDYDPGVTAIFKPTEDDINFLADHDIVSSALWGMVETDLVRIKRKGAPVVFDFCDKLDHEVIDRIIADVDYAFFSYDGEDLEFIKDYMKKIQSRGPKQVITTRGDKGSIAWDGTEFYNQGIVPCTVVDTMGAGDSYIAAYICGIVRGKSIAECMRLGAETSSRVIQYKGAW